MVFYVVFYLYIVIGKDCLVTIILKYIKWIQYIFIYTLCMVVTGVLFMVVIMLSDTRDNKWSMMREKILTCKYYCVYYSENGSQNVINCLCYWNSLVMLYNGIFLCVTFNF